MPTPSDFTIRPLETMDEFRAVEELQRQIWPGTETEVTPAHVLTTVAHNGGLTLGAFDDEQLVGFVFGFLGTDEANPNRPALTRLKHCSHQLGVLPDHRGRGVAYQLKLAQRDFVIRQGVRLITWTYDPLEARNARLNIARLGAVCRTYRRNIYGDMADALNAGLPSDRFQVDWWVTSSRVKERLSGRRGALNLESFTSAGCQILNPTTLSGNGLPHPSERFLDLAGIISLVEIPTDFQVIKARDMTLAQAWRQHTRELFEAAFDVGYMVTDFFREPMEDRERAFYAISQGDARFEYSEN
jgi:predicted GNAT superfamily acetyltransferase